jgi:hypothetical protein
VLALPQMEDHLAQTKPDELVWVVRTRRTLLDEHQNILFAILEADVGKVGHQLPGDLCVFEQEFTAVLLSRKGSFLPQVVDIQPVSDHSGAHNEYMLGLQPAFAFDERDRLNFVETLH